MTKLDSHNWKDFMKSISLLQEELSDGTPLGTVLQGVVRLFVEYSQPSDDEVESISDSYRLMSDYMLRGYQDNQRANLYRQLQRRLYRVLADLRLHVRLKYDPSLATFSSPADTSTIDTDSLRGTLEAFVSDMAILTLEPTEQATAESKQLYERRQAVIAKTFNRILLSGQWSNEHTNDFANLILSPTIDIIDALTLCAAVMMASLLEPDPAKVSMLLKVYQEATDEKLKQRALIGWALAIDNGDFRLFPETKNEVDQLMSRKGLRDELAELQMQVILCMAADEDSETIQKDVMPNIIKNQNIEITRLGIREKEENTMDEILHGDDSDRKIEEMEESMRKMIDMQKRGADIYFGGFSKMKRFGFFYTLSNWFTPYYINHPGLEHLSPEIKRTQFMESLLKNMPFCDSDKYSFSLAMSSIYTQLPDSIKEMIGNGATMQAPGADEVINTPAFFRRQFLQDLYRFFRINDSRSAFANPFEAKDHHLFLDRNIYHSTMHDEALRIIGFLLKRKKFAEAKAMLNCYYREDSPTDLLLAGRIALKEGSYNRAEAIYAKAYAIESDSTAALKGYAIASLHCAHYAKAAELYQQLSALYPDKEQYTLNEAIALINNNEAREGVRILYELYYKRQDDLDVKRVLAWGLLCMKEPEKAEKLYDSILKADHVAADHLNAGYCAWVLGKGEEAAQLFKDYVALSSIDKETRKQLPNPTLALKFREDASLLDRYGIAAIDRDIMAGMS